MARGLAAFLNSTLVDSYFRQFSGHTQVNATDLRSLRYPAWNKLVALGRRIGKNFPAQEELDRLVDEETVRRFTVHQFVQMGLVAANPDDPSRPVNSPDDRYQVAPTLLKLARTHGSPACMDNLTGFLKNAAAFADFTLGSARWC